MLDEHGQYAEQVVTDFQTVLANNYNVIASDTMCSWQLVSTDKPCTSCMCFVSAIALLLVNDFVSHLC